MSYSLPRILLLMFGGALSFLSCQTSNENTKYLDEEELDLEQVIVDSLRLDKTLHTLLFSTNSGNAPIPNKEDFSLVIYDIPEGLAFLEGAGDTSFFALLDKEIDEVHRREVQRVENLLKYYNHYFSDPSKSFYQLAYRTSVYRDWLYPGEGGNGLFPTPPEYPRFSRVKYIEDQGVDTGIFLINVEYYLQALPTFLDYEETMYQAKQSNSLEELYLAEKIYENIYLKRYVLDHGFHPSNNLPLDVANALYMEKFKQGYAPATPLIENMVEAGKRLFFLECLLPEWPDHKLIDYTKTSLDWCREYEYVLWEMFNDPKWACDLNSTSKFLRQKALGLGAGTPNLGWVNLRDAPNAPDRIGEWLGWQIVRAYATENGGYSAVETILQTPPDEIFRKSPYPQQ